MFTHTAFIRAIGILLAGTAIIVVASTIAWPVRPGE
jgi:hypothetical protein